MKKILEVHRYGEMDIRFNTDIDPIKTPQEIPDVISQAAFAMATKLWGGNEQAVLSMIRALAIADLAMSANREEMIRWLDHESKVLAEGIRDAVKEFKKTGGEGDDFRPRCHAE